LGEKEGRRTGTGQPADDNESWERRKAAEWDSFSGGKKVH
jgi:hypothetical protein